MKAFAKEMVRRGGHFPREREELEDMPGVGQYVASAALNFSHGGREPLLDVNMTRLLERYFGRRERVDIRHDPFLQEVSRQVLSQGNSVELNWAMLDFAAKVCRARTPLCGGCLLGRGCYHRRLNRDAK